MKFYISCAVVFSIVQLFACDVCGGGAANTSMGFGTLGAGNRSALGLNYQYRNFHAVHEGVFGLPDIYSVTVFNRFDLYGNIRVSPRFQLRAVIPVVYNRERSKDEILRIGISDPTILLNYFLVNQSDSVNQNQFRWIVGAGGKAPVARFTDPKKDVSQYLNPGTGTWDLMLSTSAFARWRKWGVSTDVNTTLRSANRFGYMPGNLFSAAVYGFRMIGEFSVFAGGQMMYSGEQTIDRNPVSASPATGSILAASAGLTWLRDDILIQANAQKPFWSMLNTPSSKQLIGLNISATLFIP